MALARFPGQRNTPKFLTSTTTQPHLGFCVGNNEISIIHDSFGKYDPGAKMAPGYESCCCQKRGPHIAIFPTSAKLTY